MLKTIKIIVLATLCLNFKAAAQFCKPAHRGGQSAAIEKVTSLNIGDAIPEAVWNMPLAVVNHPEGKKTITLNDYRGKLIILDFWSAWCGTCVGSLKKIDSIQQHFEDEIAVIMLTRDSQDVFDEFKSNSKYAIGITLPFFREEPWLCALFPHVSIPHLIIINHTGKIIAITGSKSVTMTTIKSLIADLPIEFPIKDDFTKTKRH